MLNTPAAWSERAATIDAAHEACGWNRLGQKERLWEAVKALAPRDGERLLDWGCGTGELSELLTGNVDYVGYDWAPGMVERAREEHPGRKFQAWEPDSADLIAAIGPFNLVDNWSKELTWLTLRTLWAKTGRALVASLYAGSDERCLSYSFDECQRFAFAESYYARVTNWRYNDLLIVLERE
jgi:predicted TPR repeat methyltransferase